MSRMLWAITLVLVAIGLLAVARRTYVLLRPPVSPGFGPAAALDAGFARHRTLTLVNIVPAGLFFCLALRGIPRSRVSVHPPA